MTNATLKGTPDAGNPHVPSRTEGKRMRSDFFRARHAPWTWCRNVSKLLTLVRHWRETRSAFSTLSSLYGDRDGALEALGGLTDEELLWAKAAGIARICGHDYGNPNPRFGVTRAVDEVFGSENVEVAGMCWRVKNGDSEETH